MKILLSSIGRRGYLVKYFKEAVGDTGEIWGADFNKFAPALQYCDHTVLLPKIIDPNYIDLLLDFCKTNHIDMVVPLIDPELEVLALNRERFYDSGIMVVVSPLETVQIAFDKYLTWQFGEKYKIDVPATVITIEDALKHLANGRLSWPVIVKPRKGSASTGVTYCHNEKQMQAAFDRCSEPIIQEYLEGPEYGFDILADKNHHPISVCCKLKLAMRAGETDQAVSVDEPDLTSLALKITQGLQLFGPMDVDVKVSNGIPKLLEMNPRFGGGYPCAHLCGADFPTKLISMYRNENLTPDINSCPAGIYMLKQDEIISPSRHQLDSIQNYQ